MEFCDIRNVSWADSVRVRLNDCIDLPAADGIYHKNCQVRFMTEKQFKTTKKGKA